MQLSNLQYVNGVGKRVFIRMQKCNCHYDANTNAHKLKFVYDDSVVTVVCGVCGKQILAFD